MAPWRRPLEAAITAQADDPASRFVQVATHGADGYPSSRTLVFRGFADDRLLFAIDSRSRKVEEIGRDPRAEACWYFRASREQFRLRGDLSLLDRRDDPALGLRSEVWATLSAQVKGQFDWPEPGAEWSEESWTVATREAGPLAPTFTLLALQAHRVDHLDLRPDPPTRLIYELDSPGPAGWRARRINP